MLLTISQPTRLYFSTVIDEINDCRLPEVILPDCIVMLSCRGITVLCAKIKLVFVLLECLFLRLDQNVKNILQLK